jgi:septum formation protein
VKLILASASPRRKELLGQIGVKFSVQPVDIDEQPLLGELPADYVQRLAREKAESCFLLTDKSSAVLGSDTTVVFAGEILGKPADKEDAVAILMRLSGNTHQVLTAVAVKSVDHMFISLVTTDVTFKTLTKAQCYAYWESGEPQDKAGSYGIQGLGAVFVEKIEGSYSAVVGLPLAETAEILEKFDIPIWQQD